MSITNMFLELLPTPFHSFYFNDIHLEKQFLRDLQNKKIIKVAVE